MAVEFGLSLPVGPHQGNPGSQWIADLEASLSGLAPYINGLWMTDHFMWGDEPTYEAWTVLAYAAARWPGYTLGPIVLGQSYRNPALLAKMAATLQDISGGRFIMGIGAGWKEDEYHAYNYPYPSPGTRVGQLEDTLEILRRMWTVPGKVTYQGKYYQIVDALCEPKPNPLPTLVVGGGGHKTMRLAARHGDWWNAPDKNFAKFSELVTNLKAACAEVGRDPATLRVTWFGRLAVANTEAEAVALSKGQWTKDNAIVGTPSQVVETFQQFIDLGVDYFICDMLGLPNPDVIGRLAGDVLPKVTASK